MTKRIRYSFDFEAIRDSWDHVLIYDIETAPTLEALERAIETGSKEYLDPMQAKHFAFATRKTNLMRGSKKIHEVLRTYERYEYGAYYIYVRMDTNAEQIAHDIFEIALALGLNIVAHAGLHFDFLVMKHIIPHRAKLVQKKANYFLRSGRKYIRMIDTFAITHASLVDSLSAFGVKEKKEYSRDMKAYLIHDLEMTCELVEAMKRSNIAYTLTRTARKFYHEYGERSGISGIDTYIDPSMKIEYAGGRVEVFRAYASNVNVYDVNSLYPYVMSNFAYPFAEKRDTRLVMNVKRASRESFEKIIETIRPAIREIFETDARRMKDFFEALRIYPYVRFRLKGVHEYFAEYEDVIRRYFPFSYVRNGRRIYAYDENITYACEGYESLFLAMFDVEIEDVYFTSSEKLFISDEIAEMYEKRKQAKERGDSLESQRLKATMVNAYGIFGLRMDRSYEETYDARDEELVRLRLEAFDEYTYRHFRDFTFIHATSREAKANVLYDETKYVFHIVERDFAKHMTAPLIATATTASGRFYLLSNIYYIALRGGEVYYVDTDSLFTNIDLPTSNELGAMKHEYTAEKAFFFAPKTYIAIREGDQKPLVKAKGTGRSLTKELVIQSFRTEHRVIRKLALAQNRRTMKIPREDGWLEYVSDEVDYFEAYADVLKKAYTEIEDVNIRSQIEELMQEANVV